MACSPIAVVAVITAIRRIEWFLFIAFECLQLGV